MLSPEALLVQLERLARNTANPPAPDSLGDLCVDWMELLGSDLDDASLRRAVSAHLRRSKFWPTPSELLVDAPAQVATQPAAVRAHAEALFPLVVRARSSCGKDASRAAAYLAHFGVADPADQAAALAAIGDWARWDAGDPVEDVRSHAFARKAFAEAFVERSADVRRGTLLLPAPPSMRQIESAPAVPEIEWEPDPTDLQPDELVIRWTLDDAKFNRCDAAQVGRIRMRRTRSAPPQKMGDSE